MKNLPIDWDSVQKMNSIRVCVTESVIRELIFI